MFYPHFVNIRNTIGIPAPSAGAGVIEKLNKMQNAKAYFEKEGFKIILSDNIKSSIKGRSADKMIRAKEIKEMFQNKDVDMLLCATGGDFLIEILPYLDFDLIKKHPKLIAGFSDATGLLYSITTLCDIATIYGFNFSSFGATKLYKCHDDFLKLIKGEKLTFTSYDLYEEEYPEKITGLEGYNLTEKVIWKTLDNKDVKIKGRIIGGCLDIISEIAGTRYDGIKKFNEKYQEDGIVWYFDNCELSMEETIRTLWKLNEFAYFKYTKLIIFGRFGVSESYYDYDVKSTLEDSVLADLNIPIIYDADISHKAPCMPIINGALASVETKNNKGKITFELK